MIKHILFFVLVGVDELILHYFLLVHFLLIITREFIIVRDRFVGS